MGGRASQLEYSGAVTADIGVDIADESDTAEVGLKLVCRYGESPPPGIGEGPEMTRLDAERLVKRRCNEGFLSLRARAEEGEAGSEAQLDVPKDGKDRLGIDLLGERGIIGELSPAASDGNWMPPKVDL